MLNCKGFAQLATVFLLTVVCLNACDQGTVQLHQECVPCNSLPHTISPHNTVNSCQCDTGFRWSPQQVSCILLPNLQSANSPQRFQDMYQQIEVGSGRLLQLACDTSKGFINKNNMCLNCRDIVWSSGLARTQISCFCLPPYIWNTYYKVCGCYIENTNILYIDGSSCKVCNAISSTTTNSKQCNSCNGGTFGYSLYGCVNCTSIPFGTGAVAGSVYGMCSCQTGYTFNLWLAACICNFNSRYALTAANTCQACSSLPAASQSDCQSCSSSFFLTGYICQTSSLVRNYNATSRGCQANFVLTNNPISNQTTSCVCSAANGYYSNNASCLSCTTNPIAGVASTSCFSCANSAGFFRTAKQCIYCPNAPYSTATANINGCVCQANYYWSAVSSSCLCDWTKNFFGVPGSCINCLSLPNTVAAFLSTGCTCVTGYVWNGNQCVCIPSSSTFILAGKCINCNAIPGAAPIVAAGGNSCVCMQGQTWDPTKLQCICDYTQNYWMINGVCYDCTAVAKTNGVATSSGCQCGPGLSWINSTNKCDCPAGYINMGAFCRLCSNVTLPSGATVAGCQICNVSQGFFLSGGICYACASQRYTTGAATSTGCTCTNSSLAWVTAYGSCVCTFKTAFTTTIINGALSCVACPTSRCQCGYPGGGTIYSNNICINCVGIPNSNGIAIIGVCGCNTGYAFTSDVYPYQCYCSFKLGYYLSAGCKSCAALPSTGATTSAGCQICSFSQGFIYLSNDTCIQCSTLPGTNGQATASGCGCTSGSWNSILAQCVNVICSPGFIYSSGSQQCICNANNAITSGTSCILCSSIPSSNGVPSSPTTCNCNPGFVWTISSSGPGSCTSVVSSCNVTTSVIIGVVCYNCFNAQFSTGPVVGTANCICPSPLVWIYNTSTNTGACICISPLQIPSNTSTGVSCLCNPAYAIPSLTNACTDCRTLAYSTNTTVSGVCGCVINFIWSATPPACICPSPFILTGGQCGCNPTTSIPINGSCFLCSRDASSTGVSTGTTCVCQLYSMWNGTACMSTCNSTSVITGSPTSSIFTCLNCGSNGTFTLARINATTCSCLSGLFWNSLGYCDCGSNSAMIITGTTFACVVCNSAVFSTGRNNSYACACPVPLTWNPNTRSCDCGPSAIVAYSNSVYSCVNCNSLIYASNRLNIRTCNCISSSFVWSASTYQCNCATANSVISVSAAGTFSCLVCNSTIYAVSAVSTSTCSCQNSFSWSPNVGCVCNNAAIIVGTGSTATCLNCNSAIYAVAKGLNNICICMSPVLVWSPSTNRCSCPTSNTVISVSSIGLYTCVPCNSTIYALSAINSTACSCSLPLTWSSTTYQCRCPIANNVIFVSSTGLYSCVACDSSRYAISALNSTACSCNNALFVWSPNVGCVCSNSAAIIIGTGTTATCIVCNSTIFSIGKSSTSNSCICQGTLTWQGTACGCVAPQVILSSNTCGAPSITCPPTMVLLPNNTCIGCTILNYALSRFNSTVCNCLGTALAWNSAAGRCQCITASSILFALGGTFTCLICNATIYATGPATPTTCACMGTGLIWLSTVGTCGCNPISVINTQGGSLTCVMCTRLVYALNKNNTSTCNCIDNSFLWTGTNCTCPSGSIIGNNFKCLQCPTNATINLLACNCSTSTSPFSIWNDITQTCVACGTAAVPNSMPAFFGVACQCNAGFIWDVMTNACITSCSGSACPMPCNSIRFTIPNSLRVALGVTRNIVASASLTIQSYYLAAGSDYSSLNTTFACSCQTGTFWNSLTMRCYSQSFNLV